LKRVRITGRRITRGNQALKPPPRGVRLMLEPRKAEKVERVWSSGGCARRVVKLNVRGMLGG
jgi:hypothetical protein